MDFLDNLTVNICFYMTIFNKGLLVKSRFDNDYEDSEWFLPKVEVSFYSKYYKYKG